MNLIDNIISIYDNNGKSADRYTAVVPFDASKEYNGSKCIFFGFDEDPTNPLGIGQSGEAMTFIHRPTSKHLGKRIMFSELPLKAQNALWSWVKDSYIPVSLVN